MSGKINLKKRLALWAVLLGLYLLATCQAGWTEIIAGSVVAGLVAGLLTFVARQSPAGFNLRGCWFLRLARRLPGKALADCAVLLRALGGSAGMADSEFRAVPFDPDAESRPDEAAARRALVIVGASLSPNSLVVAVNPAQDCLLVHQLVPTRQPPGNGDRVWPL